MGLITKAGNQDRGTLEAARAALEGIFENTFHRGRWYLAGGGSEARELGKRPSVSKKVTEASPRVFPLAPGGQRVHRALVLLVRGPVRAEKQALAKRALIRGPPEMNRTPRRDSPLFSAGW